MARRLLQDIDLTQVVIIAGGKAKRLGLDTPKCLLEISGRTLIERCIQSLRLQGFRDLVLLLGHRHEMVLSHLKSVGLDSNLRYSVDPPSTNGWGKGKALKYAFETDKISSSKRVMVIFPDDIILDSKIYSRLLTWHRNAVTKHETSASLVLVPKIQVPYGVAQVDQDGIVRKFVEKPMISQAASVGLYIFEPSVFSIIRKSIDLEDNAPLDLESTIMPKLVSRRQLSALFISAEKWLPVNTLIEYEIAKRTIAGCL